MSYLVTRLVRAARLPKSLRCRPTAKGILLALADDCGDDGGGAYTSVATMALEAAASPRTIDAHLRALQRCGLLEEQAPPRQHRPRTWRLNLGAIARLSDPQAVAKLDESDQQLVASLKASPSGRNHEPDEQTVATLADSDPQLSTPDPQNSTSGTHAVATERLNGDLNQRDTAPAARFSAKAKEPNKTNFHPIRKLAIEVLIAQPGLAWADFVEEVKTQCGALRIDYGRDDAVPFDVVHRACAAAQGHIKFRRAG